MPHDCLAVGGGAGLIARGFQPLAPDAVNVVMHAIADVEPLANTRKAVGSSPTSDTCLLTLDTTLTSLVSSVGRAFASHIRFAVFLGRQGHHTGRGRAREPLWDHVGTFCLLEGLINSASMNPSLQIGALAGCKGTGVVPAAA